MDLILIIILRVYSALYIFVVDFNYILEQACSQETALGEMLQLCECYGCGEKLKSEARIQIVEV